MSAPVKHTCPDIDKVIRQIRSALKIANGMMKQHERGSDDWHAYDDIDTELRNLEWDLEDLRSSNTALREWGEGLSEELETAANTINELGQKLETA